MSRPESRRRLLALSLLCLPGERRHSMDPDSRGSGACSEKLPRACLHGTTRAARSTGTIRCRARARAWRAPARGRDPDRVLERVLAKLAREPDNEWFLYFVQLASFHEDMHAEAFHYTRQTLGYPDPLDGGVLQADAKEPEGDAEIPGGTYPVGA